MPLQLDPAEIEQIVSSFPCVSINQQTQQPGAATTTTQLLTVTITVPDFTAGEQQEDLRAQNEADYQHAICVVLILSVRSSPTNAVKLKELAVTSSSPSSSLLTEQECDVLQSMYVELLLATSETGGEDDSLSFSASVEEGEAQGGGGQQQQDSKIVTTISSNGALFSLLAQVVTDATDTQLTETLAAHQLNTTNKSTKNKAMMFTAGTCGSSPSSSSSASSTSSPLQTPNQQRPVGDFPGGHYGGGHNNHNHHNNNFSSSSSSSNNNNLRSSNTVATSSSFASSSLSPATATAGCGCSTAALLASANGTSVNKTTEGPLSVPSDPTAKYSSATNKHHLVTASRDLFIRVRICKIDHMRNEKMYLSNISDNLNALKVDPIATAFDVDGILGILAVQDPHSPRVLLCVLSLLTAAAAASAVGSSGGTASSTSTNSDNNSTSSLTSIDAIPCAGSQLIKELRVNVTDVDSRGRTCRERCMRDLGGWTIVVNASNSRFSGNNNKHNNNLKPTCHQIPIASLAEYWKNFWGSEQFKKLTPASRDEGVNVIKKFFVEPFASSSSSSSAAIVQDILASADLWNHV